MSRVYYVFPGPENPPLREIVLVPIIDTDIFESSIPSV